MSELLPIEDAAVNYARSPLSARQAYVGQLAQASHLLPRAVVNQQSWEATAAATFYIAEVGAMMGIHPLEALSGIHLIEGRWTISAGLMSSLVRQAGHKLRVTESGSWRDKNYVARCSIVRSDDPDFEHVAEFGFEDAEQAGLTGKKGPWQNYPKAMCKARAISACARQAAEDALGGARYTPEELGATVNEEGDVIVIDAEPSAPRQAPKPAAASETAPPPPNGTAPTAAPAPEQIPDDRIIAGLAPEVLAHARSMWEAVASTDPDAITGVWQSAKAARIMNAPAVRVEGETVTLYGRDESGAPINLGTMIRSEAPAVKARYEAAFANVAPAEDGSDTHAEAAPAPEPGEGGAEVVEGEIVDEAGAGDPSAA